MNTHTCYIKCLFRPLPDFHLFLFKVSILKCLTSLIGLRLIGTELETRAYSYDAHLDLILNKTFIVALWFKNIVETGILSGGGL